MASCVQCRAVASAARPAAGRAPPSSSAFIGGSSGLRAPLRASSRPPARRVAVQGLFGLGVPEIAVIAGVTALIFGPSKLPELGKGLGKTVKNFQTAAKEFEQELKDATAPDEPEGEQKKIAPAAEKKDEAAPKA